MKVLVVSLRRAAERRRFMRQQLDAIGADYEIVDAVDHRELGDRDLAWSCDERALRESNLVRGVYACALSHVEVYKRVAREDWPTVLVLEDDALLPPDLGRVLRLVEREIEADEVVLLSYYSHRGSALRLSNQRKALLPDGMQLAYPVDIRETGSGMAYVITSRVAARMAAALLPIACAADEWGKHYGRGAFAKLRCLYPQTMRAAPFRTTIDYVAARSPLSRAAALVTRYRVPLLHRLLARRSSRRQDAKYTYEFTDAEPFCASGEPAA